MSLFLRSPSLERKGKYSFFKRKPWLIVSMCFVFNSPSGKSLFKLKAKYMINLTLKRLSTFTERLTRSWKVEVFEALKVLCL